MNLQTIGIICGTIIACYGLSTWEGQEKALEKAAGIAFVTVIIIGVYSWFSGSL
jgi:hypothetical protein